MEGAESSMKKHALFISGEGGYSAYRIPAVITLPDNRVIAFCEGRLGGLGDSGTIHIVARISRDGGCTWGEQRLVAADGENTVGNPCPVYDRDTGELHLLLNGNLKEGGEPEILQGKAPRTVLYTHSMDGGETWAPLRDLTAAVKKPNWTWYAMGPGHAQQLSDGRILIPCNHALLPGEENSGCYISHAIYSDDHGKTWNIGADVGQYTNECSLAQLPDGRIYMNMRSYHGEGCRAVAYSADRGESWGAIRLEHALPDPVCQGSVLAAGDRLLFTNAADSRQRVCLTLRTSADAGETWSTGVTIHQGPAAYSDVTVLPDGRVGCLYECGDSEARYAAYERIEWAVLDADEVK